MERAALIGDAARGGDGLDGLARWWRDSVAEPVLSVLFPPRCVGCGEFETHLCGSCRDTLRAIGPSACPRCGEPGPISLVGGRCARCMGSDFSYAGARGAFRHEGAARHLVAEFKFGGQPVLGRLMAELARSSFSEYVLSICPHEQALVTWVPCHKAAERQRGYNQAEVLARWLARGEQPFALAPLVRKRQVTKHQKGLGKAGRQENLHGAFAVERAMSARVPGQTRALILVDDVYTTGATAKEVSSILSSGTGLPVHVFTFSRAVVGGTEGHD